MLGLSYEMKVIDPFGLLFSSIFHLELTILWRIDRVCRERLITVELAGVEAHILQQLAPRSRHVGIQDIVLNVFPRGLGISHLEWLKLTQAVAVCQWRCNVSKFVAAHGYGWARVRCFCRSQPHSDHYRKHRLVPVQFGPHRLAPEC